MARVVSVFLPTLATDRVRRMAEGTGLPPETPLALAGLESGRRVVLAADDAARTAGIRIGMAAAMARTLVPGLVIRNADPKADARVIEHLALRLQQYLAPVVAPDPPDGIVIDSTGADHLHGGETAMLAALIEDLAGSSIRARAAIADSWGAAHALARFAASPVFCSAPGAAVADIAPLPVAGLRLAPEMCDALHGLGFTCIGDLLAQPRAPLARRFGSATGRRLDQAAGRIAEPIEPVRPDGPAEVRRIFAEPIVVADAIARHAGILADRLCRVLEFRGHGARRLDLVCHRVDRRAQLVRIGTSLPLRDAGRMTRLLTDRIETIDPCFGIESMTLTATVTEPLAPRQAATGLVDGSLIDDSGPDIADLVDLLANRVGARNIYRLAPVASDVPERSVRRVPALAPEAGAEWPAEWPRPPRLFARPEPIETVALLPDQPPVLFTWRGVRRRVKRADGPERIYGEWWKRDAELAAVRDYFRIEDEAGGRYWVFRAGDGEDPCTGPQLWFLHGIFG